MLINSIMNTDIRNTLNLLESIQIDESSRGLLYREVGDAFFKGADRNNPEEEIQFKSAEYLSLIHI